MYIKSKMKIHDEFIPGMLIQVKRSHLAWQKKTASLAEVHACEIGVIISRDHRYIDSYRVWLNDKIIVLQGYRLSVLSD